jgi:threonine dehydrogenase-like Zn-dependent dehydrogenase
VGIDGTDREIDDGLYGEAPPGEPYLVLGHESLGAIDAVGEGVTGLRRGEPVVAMVRRPGDCLACRSGEPDMCLGGEYTERGIKGRHGYLSEYYVESPRYLVPVPAGVGDAAVLLEPLSVVEKGIRHAWVTQQARMRWWKPRRALVLGAGAVGLLGTMLLRLQGIETFVYARTASATRTAQVGEIGATYVAQEDASHGVANHIGDLPGRYGPFDFLLEATGTSTTALGAMRIIGTDGILCLASITGGEREVPVCASCLNMDLVLGNKVVFGTVNAGRVDFESGAAHLAEAAARWPGWLDRLITKRVPLDRIRDALERQPGETKTVVEVAP